MTRSNCFHLLDPRRRDGSSSPREGFEAALQSKGHAFEQTSMDHVGKRMPIQNSTKIRGEPHSTGDLSQTSEEDFGTGDLGGWRQVLRVPRIANDCVGGDVTQQKRWGRETRRADHDVGRRGKLLKIRRDLDLNALGLQFGPEPA